MKPSQPRSDEIDILTVEVLNQKGMGMPNLNGPEQLELFPELSNHPIMAFARRVMRGEPKYDMINDAVATETMSDADIEEMLNNAGAIG